VDGNGRTSVAEAVDLAPRHDVDFVPTYPDETDVRRAVRHRRIRRICLVALFALLGLGLAGMLGARTRTTTVHGGGYDLTVTYGQISRPGLATAWSLKIHHAGGFDGPVTVATSSDYLDLFDQNGFDPQPSKETQSGDEAIWEFEPPPGDTLVASIDARVDPSVQRGAKGTTSVLVDGRPVVTAHYRTWVLP
jgi:hypothetical protein